MFSAAIEGNQKEIQKRLKKQGKAAVNIKDKEQNQTVLHLCAEHNHLDLVQILIDRYKADVNAVDKNGWTPLHAAASK